MVVPKYPIFQESIKYTFNKSYKIQLAKFSKGKFPKYISIQCDNFTMKVGNTVYSISMNSDPYDILQFYIKYFKLRNKPKKHNKEYAFEDDTSLKKMTSYYYDSLLMNYCESKKVEWKLTHQQYKQLLAFIHKNLLCGHIQKDKIKVINSKIDKMPIRYRNGKFTIKK